MNDRSGPLTYRTYDGRRRARFLDILSLFNRINNSKIRIAELEALRRKQTQERVEFRQASNLLFILVVRRLPGKDENCVLMPVY